MHTEIHYFLGGSDAYERRRDEVLNFKCHNMLYLCSFLRDIWCIFNAYLVAESDKLLMCKNILRDIYMYTRGKKTPEKSTTSPEWSADSFNIPLSSVKDATEPVTKIHFG